MPNHEGTIGVVGVSGSGKSTLGNRLGQFLGIPVIDAGQFFREALAQMGFQLQEGVDIPLTLDREVDARTLELLGQHVIIVGRTVTWLARQQHLERKRYIGVGVICPMDTLVERAIPNWNVKKKMPIDSLPPSRTHVFDTLLLRDRKDMQRFGKLYSVNSAAELYGVPPNDIQVNSAEMDVDTELQFVLSQIALMTT